MGGYIRMDKDLHDDPRIADLGEIYAALRGVDQREACNAVIGGLFKLWCHGDTHLGRHNRLKGASHGLARISEVTALPVAILEHFPSEWLRVLPGGAVELPDYAQKNSLIDRDIRRFKGRERTRRWRENKLKIKGNGNASHLVTQETSHRHQNVTTGTGTGTGTGTETTETGTGTGPLRSASPSPAVAVSASLEKSDPKTPLIGPLTDTVLQTQVTILRGLGWDDARILAKWRPRGMTQAHLAMQRSEAIERDEQVPF